MLLKQGASPLEVRAWLERADPQVFVVERQGMADEMSDVLRELASGTLTSGVIKDVLDFLLAESGRGAIHQEPRGEPNADFVVLDAAGRAQITIEVKTWPLAPTDWIVQVSSPAGAAARFNLNDTDFSARFQAWLEMTTTPSALT
jgi:hypothetical protein